MTCQAAWIRFSEQLILIASVVFFGSPTQDEVRTKRKRFKIYLGEKREKETRCSALLFTFVRAGGEES